MSAFVNVVIPVPVNEAFTYSLPADTECSTGSRVEVLFRSRKMTGYVIKVFDEEPDVNFIIKPVLRVIDSEPLFGPYQIALGEWISKRYFCSLGEAIHMMLPGGRKEIQPEGMFEDGGLAGEKGILLSDEQELAVSGILSSDTKTAYVYGITGSGKTEVFLRCAKSVLSQGKAVIYLVPEIALTHQLVSDIGVRFGETVGVIHSRLTPSQKLDQWKRIKKGELRFIIGARSAVFAPAENLGMIIIDEEHENSYKSGSSPRYHARQVAMKICGDTNAKLVMGSATPSVEAYYSMKQKSIRAFHLTKRLSGGTLPEIKVINLKGSSGPLSQELIEMIHRTKEQGHQSILFLNRRGFSYFFHCRTCGYELKCKRCSVAMTYHKSNNKLICHYCGYSRTPVDTCPECGSLETGYSGFGTQRIEEDINATFPGFSIARLDTDSVKKKGALEHIIKKFKRGETDILLGTQMVAKGLNFPNVKLVGIVQADTSLKLPDFRSAERTFSLITQVAGRAGRFFPDGKVVIQTYMPDNPAIALAAEYRTENFYDQEIEIRRMLNFPPFSRVIRIVVRGKSEKNVIALIERMAGAFGAETPEGIEILGPSECPLSVISGNYRYQLILRSGDYPLISAFVSHYYRQIQPARETYIEIDPDPQSLL